jgi:NADH-quinone oxidoreductase subunit N
MMATDYLGLLRLALPEAVLALAVLAVLGVDLLVMRGVDRRYRRLTAAALTAVGCVASGLVLTAGAGVEPGVGGAMRVSDPLVWLVQGALLALAVFTAAVSVEQDLGDDVGEFYALLLLSTIGMLMLVATEHLLMIFVSLELTSLSLYVLAGLNKRNPRSAEAALKYFLFGSVAGAFGLFGFSWLYGVTGSVELRGIAEVLRGRPMDAGLAVATVMVVIGFGFKVAAVPFHLWAPDTYQGAPNSSAAFIASSSKVASFVILAKLVMMGLPSQAGGGGWQGYAAGWVPLLSVLALLSLVLGNLAALVQSSVKRLLAYSAVAHAGYTLVGVAADSVPGLVAVVYYTITYAVAALGAFAVAGLVEDRTGDSRLEHFAGLSRRSPWLAFCLMIFLLSLAGIPPLAGFYGKFALFVSAVEAGPGHGLLWLVVVAVAASTISLYYYLLVLKQAYVAEGDGSGGRLRTGPILGTAVGGLALLTLLLGCLPGLLVGPLTRAFAAAGW